MWSSALFLLLDGLSYLNPLLIFPLEWFAKQFEEDPEKLTESMLQMSKMQVCLLFLSLQCESWEIDLFKTPSQYVSRHTLGNICHAKLKFD